MSICDLRLTASEIAGAEICISVVAVSSSAAPSHTNTGETHPLSEAMPKIYNVCVFTSFCHFSGSLDCINPQQIICP